MSSLGFGFIAAAIATVVPSIAGAEEGRAASTSFGHRGQIVLDELLGVHSSGSSLGILGAVGGFGYYTGLFTVATSSASVSDGSSYKSTLLGIRPSLDVFVAERFSIGGAISASYAWTRQDTPPQNGAGTTSTDSRSYGASFEPRIGFAVRLTDSLSFWPRAGVGYRSVWMDQGGVLVGRTDAFSAFTRLGLVANLGRFAYFDIGPEVRIMRTTADSSLAVRGASTTASAGIGGVLGLAF